MGEVLLDVRGKVAEVWTIHEADLSPPFPAFNQAIVDAIRRWEFEPLMVNERATSACTTVTVMINWS
jgi:outer membrane biosynthesis protein TonB